MIKCGDVIGHSTGLVAKENLNLLSRLLSVFKCVCHKCVNCGWAWGLFKCEVSRQCLCSSLSVWWVQKQSYYYIAGFFTIFLFSSWVQKIVFFVVFFLLGSNNSLLRHLLLKLQASLQCFQTLFFLFFSMNCLNCDDWTYLVANLFSSWHQKIGDIMGVGQQGRGLNCNTF